MKQKHTTTTPLRASSTSVALECGSLAVFLSQLHQPQTVVFLSPLTFITPNGGGNSKQTYLVHVTARTSQESPIVYASFLAAQTIGSALVAPSLLHSLLAVTRAQQLQEEMHQCLRRLIEAHPTVKEVVSPARLRLPDEWVWKVHSQAAHIHYRDEHWVLLQEKNHD